MDKLYLEDLRIDSLVDLLKAAYSFEEWDKMIEIAGKLLLSAERVYSKQQQSLESGKRYVYLDGKRHIVYYFGFSQLMKGIALGKKELYEESLACIKDYSDLSWLDDGSKEAGEEISAFKVFAKGNTFSISLLEGKQEYLDPYVQFLKESRVEELLPGLMTILVSAINHGFHVDSVFDHFKGKIGEAIEICSKSGEAIYITKFFYTLLLYHLKMKPHQVALHNILQAIEASDNYKDVSQYKVSVSVKDIIAVCSCDGTK